jgi:DNA topoisomerase-2
MDHYDFEEMYPYFRGFTGDISSTEKGGFLIKGKYNIIDDEYIEITELPIRKWTRDFKNFLEE